MTMMSFRKAVAAAALTAAAVMASAGAAVACGSCESTEQVRNEITAHCNDASTQIGAINFNQGPVCIDFASHDSQTDATRGMTHHTNVMNAACNSAVTQIGAINYNHGPVCIRF
ncbi:MULTISPECIES: hypothetical protein [unclassified Streptomyces]|uniref:hypothetical protein n=1 Tax=unclassified Streptomyces TaxID=2593676 RepID=UPI00192848A1|nr:MULTISPECIES: hypothetical protein [unclassified Streptomyces]